MIEVNLIQEQEYGDRIITTSVNGFKDAMDLTGILGVENEDIEIRIRLKSMKEVNND